MVSEQQAERAVALLKRMIDAAENSNQAGEDAVVAAATGPALLISLERVIEAAERALGDHAAPHDCFATGPLTGNPIADLIACPGCAQQNEIAEARKVLAKARGQS